MFKRGIETISDLGIGRLSNVDINNIKGNFDLKELNIIYEKIRLNRGINIKFGEDEKRGWCTNGRSVKATPEIIQKRKETNNNKPFVPIEQCSETTRIKANNLVVNAIRLLRKKEVKNSSFTEQDLLKINFNGNIYFGWFKGTDKYGRVLAYGNSREIKVGLKECSLASPEEVEAFKKECIETEKAWESKEIEIAKRMSEKGFQHGYMEELLKSWKKKYNEEYKLK